MSTTRAVNPTDWSAKLGYDQGRLHTEPSAILTFAAQGPFDEQGRLLHEGDVAAQLALALANVAGVLDEAGMTLADVAQLRIYATDIVAALDAYDAMVEHLMLESAAPPVSVIEVTRLCFPGMAVAVDGLAIR